MGVGGGVPRAGREEEGLAMAESLLSTEDDSLVFFPGDGLFGEHGHGLCCLGFCCF